MPVSMSTSSSSVWPAVIVTLCGRSVLCSTGLVESGLLEKEARAMVNTWTESYFKSDGVRALEPVLLRIGVAQLALLFEVGEPVHHRVDSACVGVGRDRLGDLPGRRSVGAGDGRDELPLAEQLQLARFPQDMTYPFPMILLFRARTPT